jgi:hypothetical protein
MPSRYEKLCNLSQGTWFILIRSGEVLQKLGPMKDDYRYISCRAVTGDTKVLNCLVGVETIDEPGREKAPE